jgi:hypothetical protein
MLQELKSMFSAGTTQTRSERAAAIDLEGKPIAKALLLRGAEYQDDAILFAKRMGSKRTVADEGSLNEFAASCAATVAAKVTYDALKALGRPDAFFPYEPVPNYAPMVVAFSLFVLESTCAHLKAEKVDLDFPTVAAQTAGLFFVSHPEAERIENAKRGIGAFQSVAQIDVPHVKEWRDTFFKIVPMYVLQWTTTKQDLKAIDFNELFASKLAGLLKAIE